jgi:hypothetical protein
MINEELKKLKKQLEEKKNTEIKKLEMINEEKDEEIKKLKIVNEKKDEELKNLKKKIVIDQELEGFGV